MTRPTGKTKPPRTLTSPGFDAVKAGEPPVITTLRRPPNDNMTPARTCNITVEDNRRRKTVTNLPP